MERILATIEDVGLSITLTTVTTATAFGLGLLSSIPAVFWLVLYAFPTVLLVFIYQLTFLVACIILDEQRIQDNRRDCCCWVRASDHITGVRIEGQDHIADRFMGWLGEQLVHPKMKILVLFVFGAFAAVCGWRTSLLEQQFSFTSVLPRDSYLKDLLDGREAYTNKGNIVPGIYFRDVDQADPVIQDQMFQFIEDLVATEQISSAPEFFWLSDFQRFINRTASVHDIPFKEQVDLFLQDPVFWYMHHNNIARDEMGNVTASRVYIDMDLVDPYDVNQNIAALQSQHKVTQAQPINQGRNTFAFFTYVGAYNMWEFYSVSIQELVMTTIIGVVSVTGIAMLMIPHWTAGPIVFPFICVLYVNLLGVIQMAGIYINAVSYIAVTMAIGLLVDFIMHCLLRYYEVPGNRREKCVGMLRTMGSSVLLGGISTFLGTMLLAFASSEIFYTLFVVFLGIVMLGISHGLILLPVVLSIVGPEDQVAISSRKSSWDEHWQPKGKKVLIYM